MPRGEYASAGESTSVSMSRVDTFCFDDAGSQKLHRPLAAPAAAAYEAMLTRNTRFSICAFTLHEIPAIEFTDTKKLSRPSQRGI